MDKKDTLRHATLQHATSQIEDNCVRFNCAKIWHKGAIDRFPNPVLHPRHVVPLHQVMILGTSQWYDNLWVTTLDQTLPEDFPCSFSCGRRRRGAKALQQQLQQQQQLGKIAKTLEDSTYTRRVGVKVKQWDSRGLTRLGLTWIDSDWLGLTMMDSNWFGLNGWRRLTRPGLTRMYSGRLELNWIDLDWFEWTWIELNWLRMPRMN